MAPRTSTADTAAEQPPEGHGSQHWNCGNRHLAGERILRIVERAPGAGWTVKQIALLHELAQEAGPLHCRRSIDEADHVPF